MLAVSHIDLGVFTLIMVLIVVASGACMESQLFSTMVAVTGFSID